MQSLVDQNTDCLGEYLNLQLTEIEMLQSMFEEGKEICVDHDTLAQAQEYLVGNRKLKPNKLKLNLRLFIKNDDVDSLLVNFSLPHEYPKELPDVDLKCDSFRRESQKQINDLLNVFLTTLEKGEECIVTIIQWLQENWPKFFEKQLTFGRMTKNEAESKQDNHEQNMCRTWLYMHHIHSKTKRKHILDWAHESKLTGFSLPGKPGVVCIEGDSRDTEEYFARLRRLNWKKIQCRHREEKIKERRFSQFKEIIFQIHGSGDNRMDFGEFFQYLVDHNLGDIFKILFGIEGKLNSK